MQQEQSTHRIFADEKSRKCGEDEAKCRGLEDIPGLIFETDKSLRSVELEAVRQVNPGDQVNEKEHMILSGEDANVQAYWPEEYGVDEVARNQNDRKIQKTERSLERFVIQFQHRLPC